MIWHDAEKAKRLSQSQPIRWRAIAEFFWRDIDWKVIFWYTFALMVSLSIWRGVWALVKRLVS
jgi:hypothetical protein